MDSVRLGWRNDLPEGRVPGAAGGRKARPPPEKLASCFFSFGVYFILFLLLERGHWRDDRVESPQADLHSRKASVASGKGGGLEGRRGESREPRKRLEIERLE